MKHPLPALAFTLAFLVCTASQMALADVTLVQVQTNSYKQSNGKYATIGGCNKTIVYMQADRERTDTYLPNSNQADKTVIDDAIAGREIVILWSKHEFSTTSVKFNRNKTYAGDPTEPTSTSSFGFGMNLIVTPTNRYKTILGHWARLYIVRISGEIKKTMGDIDIWAAADLPSSLGDEVVGSTDFPVRGTMLEQRAWMNKPAAILDVRSASISYNALPQSLFDIPHGLTRVATGSQQL